MAEYAGHQVLHLDRLMCQFYFLMHSDFILLCSFQSISEEMCTFLFCFVFKRLNASHLCHQLVSTPVATICTDIYLSNLVFTPTPSRLPARLFSVSFTTTVPKLFQEWQWRSMCNPIGAHHG